MRILLLVGLLIMSGCAKVSPNTTMVREIKYCQENGLKAHVVYDFVGFMSLGPVGVNCLP